MPRVSISYAKYLIESKEKEQNIVESGIPYDAQNKYHELKIETKDPNRPIFIRIPDELMPDDQDLESIIEEIGAALNTVLNI